MMTSTDSGIFGGFGMIVGWDTAHAQIERDACQSMGVASTVTQKKKKAHDAPFSTVAAD
jgi:hypothetical protein